MKMFFTYLKYKLKTVAASAVFAVIFASVFAMYRLPLEAVLYPTAICAVFGIVILIVDFARKKQIFETLSRLGRATFDLSKNLPSPDSLTDEGWRALSLSLGEQADETNGTHERKYREMIDYYTTWAHQIKTPISAMKLTLQNEDSPLSRQLTADLFRIEQYVGMVLAFLRLDSESSDYVFREYDADELLRAAVRKFAPEFIARRLTLDYEPVNTSIVTDEKWFSFLIEHLLSNALKYTRQGGEITMKMSESHTLSIADTGIGIAEEDLPRVFERGYTGQNGRADKAASGLGLYLCKRICDSLGISVEIRSTVGVGTEVRLSLVQSRLKID